MRPDVVHAMAAVERDHWWFAARRRIVADVLDRRLGPGDRRVLEIGCGTGGNLAMLGRYGRVTAVECDAAARAHARGRDGGATVVEGALPDAVPCAPEAWDLVVLLDVLEHVADDGASLAAVRGLLVPGGRLLVTVPAQPWLWSAHDEAHHHHRRYTAAGLRRATAAAGLRVDLLTPYAVTLLPAVAAARGLARLTGRSPTADLRVPPAPVNRLLAAVFAAERHLLGRVPLPPGVSLLMLAAREDAP